MDWYNQKIAQEQFEFFAKGIANTTLSKREPYQREIELYKYWRDVCKDNNYIYSSCLECKVENVLSQYYQNILHVNEKEKETSKVIQLEPKITEEKKVVGLEFTLN